MPSPVDIKKTLKTITHKLGNPKIRFIDQF